MTTSTPNWKPQLDRPDPRVELTAGTTTGKRGASFLSVVGFDGTEHAMRALDGAVSQLHDREGSIELVYVAAPTGNTQKISDEVRVHLLSREPRWHFQRRDGHNVPEELVAVADELRQNHGADATIAVIVGSSPRHSSHIALALIQRHRYPVVVVP
jgi:nucleotide-binding universal stress UspA family protein